MTLHLSRQPPSNGSELANLVPKYTLPEMGKIWSDAHKYELWLRVEVMVLESWAELGQAPFGAAKELSEVRFDMSRMAELEAKTAHETIAFVRTLEELAPSAAPYVHRGMTSSDVIDTALSIQLLESIDLMLGDLASLLETLRRLAFEHRETMMIGRTHGIHAEPTTFGFKMAVFHEDMVRCKERFLGLRKEVGIAKLAGPVGTHSNISPEIEERVSAKLGLAVSVAETQVIQRDRHARYIFEVALLGCCLDKIATELRSLQRTEIGEVEEPFGESQQGSSAMPHKRNPVLSERISGLARVLRGYTIPALENIPLWHERDISNSAAERVILVDASTTVDYMLDLSNHILKGLKIFPDRMLTNLKFTQGVVFSPLLLRALTDSGLERSKAYDIVQRDAFEALDRSVAFRDVVLEDPNVRARLSEETLNQLFDWTYFTRHISHTFDRLSPNIITAPNGG